MQSNVNKRKALFIALSVLVAVAIWTFVDVTNDRTVTKTIEEIPIEYLYEDTVLADRGLMLLEEGTDTSIDMTVRGTRWNIARLDPDELRVQVDLSGVTTTGAQRITYQLWLPDGFSTSIIQVSEASAYVARVNIGELNSKSVDIRPEYVGTVADGYTAGELQLSPATLEIRGQAEHIDPVSYAKVTINLDNAEATFSEMLDFSFYDENDQLLDRSGIHATVEQVQATLPVNVTKELRLTMDFTEGRGLRVANLDYTITPATITVSGDAALLRDMETLSLAAFNLSDLDNATVYNYNIVLPDGCENLSGVTRATFRASFRDMTTATLTATQFTCEHVPDGKEAVVLTDEVSVTVFGMAADVSALTGEDLVVVADLSDFSAASGSYTVPAKITVEDDRDVGFSGSYQVRVTIREPEDTPEQDSTSETQDPQD